jgi:hypothetical protein
MRRDEDRCMCFLAFGLWGICLAFVRIGGDLHEKLGILMKVNK